MPLSRAEDKWLEGLLTAYEENWQATSGWRRGFMKDQRERYEKHGADIWLSTKQWSVLYQVADDVGYARPDQREED